MRPLAIALLAVILGGVSPASAAPDPPQWVAALYVDAQKAVGLRWMPVKDATGYLVLRSETEGSGHVEIARSVQPQHFDKTVESGTTYYYVIQALGRAGSGPAGEERSVKILGRKKVVLQPPKITRLINLSTTEFGKASYKVSLSWDHVTGAIAYNVYRSEVSGEGYRLLTSGAENSLFDTSVEPEKTYFYAVTALDDGFVETDFSEERSVRVMKRAKKKRKRRVKLRIMPRTTTTLWTLWDHAWSAGEEARTAPLGYVADAAFEKETGHLYLTSTLNRSIVVIDSRDGSLVRTLGPDFEGYRLGVPLGIDVDGRGRIAVVDGKTQRVVVLSRDGALVSVIEPELRKGEKGHVLIDAAFLPDGSLFVTDNANGNVIAFDQTGDETGRWGAGAWREAEPTFSLTRGITKIAATPAGRLALVDGLAKRVRIFTPVGELHAAFGEGNPGTAGMIFPTPLVALDDGNLLVADASHIREFGPQKDPRWYVAHLSDKRGERKLEARGTMALAGDGAYALFVVDRWGNRLSAYRLGPEQKERP